MEITAAKWKPIKEKMNTQLTLEKLYDDMLRNMGPWGWNFPPVWTYTDYFNILNTSYHIRENRDDNWTSLTGYLGGLNEIVHIEHLTYVIYVSFYHWRITKIWET